MSTIAVIDVGSNSICLLVAVPLADGSVRVVEKLKDSARLRAEIGADGRLTPAGMTRALSVLRHYRTVADLWQAEVRCVATAALRAAVNADELVQRARDEAGVAVEVISGDEEARLAYLGVLQAFVGLDQPVLCADVGGGSTELLLGQGHRALSTASVPVGALVVTQQWLGSDPVAPEAVDRARRGLRDALQPALAPFVAAQSGPNGRPLLAIATSGTIQRVARIARALQGRPPQEDVQGLVLTAADFDQVIAALVAARNNAQRLAIPGMDPSRADILLGGALIYEQLSQALALPQWTVSMAGLRMGVLADLRQRLGI